MNVKNKMNKVIKHIAENNQTPFYVFDENALLENLNLFRQALLAYYPKVIIGYSVKTNYTPSIVEVAKNNGCYAEVVSTIELELAKKLNFEFGKVIFNGPYKQASDLKLAIELGSIIHFDHLYQINLFLGLNNEDKKKARIGLRANIDLSEKLLEKKIAKGGIIPRFGLNQDELSQAVKSLKDNSINIISLHGHCSSSDRSAENYSEIAKTLLDIRKSEKLENLQYIDIGGGFLGEIPNIWQPTYSPSFLDYAKAIFDIMKNDNWFMKNEPTVIIEPGMSVVANTMKLITAIVAEKKIGDSNLIGVDASFYNVRPTMHTKALPFSHIKINDSNKVEPKAEFKAIVGATCMERDILLENVELDSPEKGDLIVIENVGAYCSVLTPNFICLQPAIFHIKNETIILSKKTQNFESFFTDFIIN
jgi:diaminopimelate decarboxylase